MSEQGVQSPVMTAKPKANPEKLMLFLFPLITLGLFVAGVVLFTILPKLVTL